MNRASMVFLLAAAVLLSLLFLLAQEVEEPPVVAPLKSIDANTVAVVTSRGVVFEQYDPSAVNVRYDEFESAIPHAVGKNYIPANRPLKSETVRVELGLDESVEYKVEMNGGDSVVYEWKVLEGNVYYDFHGHPHHEETEFFNRYDEGEGNQRSGTIMAAFTGQHGWFWLNLSQGPVVIELNVSGFYDKIVEIEL